MVEFVNGVKLYLDGYLKSNLDLAKDRVKLKWDCIGLYVGDEGDGKTTLALNNALYLDPTFNIERICFNPVQFEEAVDKAPPFSAIVYDEADDLGGHWANRLLIAIKRKFKRIRKKQLFILLVTPTMFDLSKYFIIARTRYLVQVYTEGLERGYFKFYGKKGKRMLYMRGKKDWDMDAWGCDFKGRFTRLPDNFPIDMDDYELRKDEATKEIVGSAGVLERVDIYEAIAQRLYDDNVSTAKIASYLDRSQRQVQHYLAKNRLKGGDVPVLSAGEGEITRSYLPTVLLEGQASQTEEDNIITGGDQ